MSETLPQMDVSIERLTDVERKVVVGIPWDHVRGRLDEAYKELGEQVQVKGFRRGKVPRKMLEKLFGKHVTQEVAQRLVQESIPKALSDNAISPVSEPKIENDGIKDGEAFQYSAVLQVVPEIEPKDYFGVDVNVRPAKVTDDQVEQALAAKQREMAEYQAVEGRNTQNGDVILVDLMGKINNEPVSLDNQMVEIGGDHVLLPGLAEKLTGIPAEKGELDMELDIPVHDDISGGEKKEVKTQKAKLLITIKDVKQKIVPRLDDEFAKDTGEAETLAGLREVYRKKLLQADEKLTQQQAKASLMDELIKRNEVPLVPALVEQQLGRMAMLEAALMGIDPRTADLDGLKERLRDDAEKSVKKALLLEVIGKKENVTVDEAEVEKKLAEFASSRGENVSRIRSEYEKEGRLEVLRNRIREEKTLDLLMSKATLKHEDIAAEDNTVAKE